ncbi:MAG: hypothetical protein AAFU79_15795 [Myxococcota bacterium]
MNPEAARLFFGCSICFLLGGAAGVFGVRTLYGEVDRVVPETRKTLVCPPPPPCPACPPPVDCGDASVLPSSPTTDPDVEAEVLDPEAPALPGLPASVLPYAHEAVREVLEPCLAEAPPDFPGVALLQLTVTATGGEGFISEVIVLQATGGAEAAASCLEEAARTARFPWAGGDGRLTFKLPVSVGGS